MNGMGFDSDVLNFAKVRPGYALRIADSIERRNEKLRDADRRIAIAQEKRNRRAAKRATGEC